MHKNRASNILIGTYRTLEEFVDIKKEEIEGVTIFRLNGKILIGEGDEQLRQAIEDFISEGGEKLILDMANVSDVDGAGMGELVRVYTAIARASDSPLKLLNLSQRIRDFMEMTKLIEVFEVYDNEKEAIASFK